MNISLKGSVEYSINGYKKIDQLKQQAESLKDDVECIHMDELEKLCEATNDD